MSITIPDQWMKDAGFDEPSLRIEIACRLYDAGKLTFNQAIQWAELSRTEFEEAMIDRGLALYRPTVEDLHEELAAFSVGHASVPALAQ